MEYRDLPSEMLEGLRGIAIRLSLIRVRHEEYPLSA